MSTVETVKKHWIEISAPALLDGSRDGQSGIIYQCVCCDFSTVFEYQILGHAASEHLNLKKKTPRKRRSKKQNTGRFKFPVEGIDNGRFIP